MDSETVLDPLLEQTLLLFGCLRESILEVEGRMTLILLPDAEITPAYKNYYYGAHRIIRLEEYNDEEDDLLDTM